MLAYGPSDPESRVFEPGDRFFLHASEDDAYSLDDPAVGDVILLTQHAQATHLVRVVGVRSEPRPRAELRRPHGKRFPFRRECELLRMKDFEEAPLIEEAFGFDPRAQGGEVFEIAELSAFSAADTPLWLVQRRILAAFDGPSLRRERPRMTSSHRRERIVPLPRDPRR